jgi:hypothetical protein
VLCYGIPQRDKKRQIPRAAAIQYVCIVKESDTSRATAPCCSMYQLQQVNKIEMRSEVTEGRGARSYRFEDPG